MIGEILGVLQAQVFCYRSRVVQLHLEEQKAVKQSNNNANVNGRVFYLNGNNSVAYSNDNYGSQL